MVGPTAVWPRRAPDQGLSLMYAALLGVAFQVFHTGLDRWTLVVSMYSVRGAADGALLGIAIEYRLPTYLLEYAWTRLLAFSSLPPTRLPALLPTRYHDLIHFPLPGLRDILIRVGEADPAMGAALVAEMAATLGQRRPARAALRELVARALEKVARDRLWALLVSGQVPFLDDFDPARTIIGEHGEFKVAVLDLAAASVAPRRNERQRALARARGTLEAARLRYVANAPRDDEQARLVQVATRWLDVIGELEAQLARERAERPEVPTPFVAGPPLTRDQAWLVLGRDPMFDRIGHELEAAHRAPLVLSGQRRMGKTTALNLLPLALGNGTVLVVVNLQALSGSPHREHPHRIVTDAVHAVLGCAPPPDVHAWGPALDWLATVEPADRRVLIACDEIERLADEPERVANDLLDFVRAAGDRLLRTRFLLVTAVPLARLGAGWVGRLISHIALDLGPLSPAEAERLLRNPEPDFPPIWPEGGVERVIAETGCHPYLLQLVADTLTARLNTGTPRLQATLTDIDAAIDAAFDRTGLFHELWEGRTDAERDVLAAVANGRSVTPGPVVRDLIRERYLTAEPQVLMPMFAAWIREHAPG